MAKRMAAFDSAHQIGLSTSLEGVLIVVLGPSSLDFKKQRNRGQFPQYLHNQRPYGKTGGGIGFRASNRSIHVHGRRSNCSWGLFIAAFKKTAKLVTFQFISPQPEPLQQNGWQHWIQHIK